MKSDTNAIIAGSVRTLAQLVPIAGGAVAQAWSEYESHVQNKRTKEFFDQLTEDFKKLQEDFFDMSQKISSMPDAAELLEQSVAVTKRETSEIKRRMFSKLYSHYLSHPDETSCDERFDIIFHIEQLTHSDINILRLFTKNRGILRGDMLTSTVNPAWSNIGQSKNDINWLNQHGSTVHSISKLESRGLLIRTHINASFSYSGEANSPFNRFRGQAWHITPVGVKLIRAIE